MISKKPSRANLAQAQKLISDMRAARKALNESLKAVARQNPGAFREVSAAAVLRSDDPMELFKRDDEEQDEESEYTARVTQVRSRKTVQFKILKQLAETDPEQLRKSGLEPGRVLRMLALSGNRRLG